MKQQFNVYLSPDTVKQIKHRSIDEQLSLSDLVENIFKEYLASIEAKGSSEEQPPEARKSAIRLQPMLHVEDMGNALDFYRQLGATLVHGSRDGDWALLRFGTTELGLLAHPPNDEQNEGKVELNFEYAGELEELEGKLQQAGITIARPTGDEGFGYQLQVKDGDGMLVKINQTDPDLYQ